MNLTEQPEIVVWPETYYAFVEKSGPFTAIAPAAWAEAHQRASALTEHNRVTGFLSLYKMSTSTYRAGFALESPPNQLPSGLMYEVFPGGKFAKFVLIGPYSQLGAATSRVFQVLGEAHTALRDDFCIENYVNDPKSTPEAELKTEILIPVR